MSFWYKKMELARRFSVFYTASLLAGAFGGLLGETSYPLSAQMLIAAGAILKGLDGARGIPAWKWLFISESNPVVDTMARLILVEGSITCFVAIIVVFIMPDFPTNTKWLSEEERQYAIARLVEDNQAGMTETATISLPRAFVLAAKDVRTWMFSFGHSTTTAAGTVTYFIPTLVSGMGYSGTKAQFVSALSMLLIW